MNKNIITNLTSILEHYRSVYSVEESLDEVLAELLENDVEVNGDSFYCPIWNSNVNAFVLLAGTKDKADMWVMKKIIRLIKSGEPVYSMLNGNTEYLLSILERYNVRVISQNKDVAYISFNVGD